MSLIKKVVWKGKDLLKTPWINVTLALLTVTTLTLVGFRLLLFLLGLYYTNQREVADILKIKTLPVSISNIKCASPAFTTDLVESCYFEINPLDFDKLTVGWDFKKKDIYLQDLCAETGEKFEIADWLIVYPKEYKYGGSITILTNKDKSKICIQHYEE